jgi:signal transduction histidine kinase
LGRRLNLAGRDELADLGRTFDGMISRLQAAFERQRRFVADASHELRTPLTIINLEAARALTGERPVGEYRRALTIVESEAARMTRLVNDLMALARMDSGQTILQMQPVDLGEIAGEAVERLAALAAEREVQLDVGTLDELPIMGDRQYLLQMVSNLAENGVKYSGAGKRVQINATRRGNSACLEIRDTGPGIPPEHLPAVFDRFYRVDASRSQNDEAQDSPSGSGLGLSIVDWIVRAHGGEIRVDSRLGEGTAFCVTMPLIRVDTSGP